MTKWKRAEFKIAVNPRAICPDETGRRKGYVCGYFGLHKNYHTWTITHLPSGFRLGEAHSYQESKAKVVAALRLPVDWSIDDPMRTAVDLDSARARLRSMMPLSGSVEVL